MSLKHVEGKIVVRANLQSKNQHTFANGTTIRMERGWNNLNYRDKSCVNAWIVSAKGIPEGAEILVHHNALTETYLITNHGQLSGEEIGSSIRYYSLPEEQAFFWRIIGGDWQPVGGYTPALRVFVPYIGIMHGIEPTKLKDTLYITAGPLKGNVVHTLKACDYAIIFQDSNNQESQLIRCRHYEYDHEREEITAINHELTKKIKDGKLLVGIEKSDAKMLKELSHV